MKTILCLIAISIALPAFAHRPDDENRASWNRLVREIFDLKQDHKEIENKTQEKKSIVAKCQAENDTMYKKINEISPYENYSLPLKLSSDEEKDIYALAKASFNTWGYFKLHESQAQHVGPVLKRLVRSFGTLAAGYKRNDPSSEKTMKLETNVVKAMEDQIELILNNTVKQ